MERHGGKHRLAGAGPALLVLADSGRGDLDRLRPIDPAEAAVDARQRQSRAVEEGWREPTHEGWLRSDSCASCLRAMSGSGIGTASGCSPSMTVNDTGTPTAS